jgi:WD40 repeat protein
MLIHKENSELSNICRSSNSDHIAIGGKNVLKICSLTSENTLINIQKLKESKSKARTGATDLTWNPIFSNYLASCSLFSPQILLWDITKLYLPSKIGSHEQLINRINWNVNKPNLLISCSYDKSIKIWDTNNPVKKNLNEEPIPINKYNNKRKIKRLSIFSKK